ncbi:MAG: NAD-dependent malic enzyme, mitochondrial [Chrysothrix sp. TS-e1954]|nr:MAG: NAD-dependent malic enzyme, mitochondrial [Chrysothrix sp. TS-e1954]
MPEQRHKRYGHLPLSTSGPLDCALSGATLLRSPYFNKGSGFTAEERKEFDLNGLLPSSIQTLDDQVKRAYRHIKGQNEVLYYALLQEHIKEMLPIVYTPTQGDAIHENSHIFRRPSGCFLNIFDPEGLDASMAKWGTADDIDLIVVTDSMARSGEPQMISTSSWSPTQWPQILGIGDQSVGGILIAVAKLALYTLCAGVHPHRVLPAVLDCGTDTWQPHHAVFNDDIQGTGCTALSALRAAVHVGKIPIKDLRIVCFGAGSAGIGIVEQVAKAIALEKDLSLEQARTHSWLVGRPGLLLESHETLTPGQRPYARAAEA